MASKWVDQTLAEIRELPECDEGGGSIDAETIDRLAEDDQETDWPLYLAAGGIFVAVVLVYLPVVALCYRAMRAV